MKRYETWSTHGNDCLTSADWITNQYKSNTEFLSRNCLLRGSVCVTKFQLLNEAHFNWWKFWGKMIFCINKWNVSKNWMTFFCSLLLLFIRWKLNIKISWKQSVGPLYQFILTILCGRFVIVTDISKTIYFNSQSNILNVVTLELWPKTRAATI